MAKIKPITFSYDGALVPEHGITQAQIDGLTQSLEAARAEVFADLKMFADGADVPEEKNPLDAGFHEMPERILDEYQSNREGSELGRILAVAAKLRERVDKVVVLGIGGSYMGARALMETCRECISKATTWIMTGRKGCFSFCAIIQQATVPRASGGLL
jgi:glucose-6-phosphate isomerase